MKKKAIIKLPYLVGTYQLCRLNVDLRLVEGYCSGFNSRPTDIDVPCLDIGARQDQWWRIFDCVMHEAIEFALVQFGYAYIPTSVSCLNSTTYVFHLDHGELVRVLEDASYFAAKAMPDVAKAWNSLRMQDKVT